MKHDTRSSAVQREYAGAHEVHYQKKDLKEALELYRSILCAFPDSPEAGYSRSQIRNIVKAVVPDRELLDAEVDLALARVGDPEKASPAPPSTDGHAR